MLQKKEHTRPPIAVGLIRGRHCMPVSEYIFDSVEDVHDYAGVHDRVSRFLSDRVGISLRTGTGINQSDYTDVRVFQGDNDLVVYVTGLTSVVAEVVAACLYNGVHLTLMHYDTETGGYRPQRIS